MKLISISAVHAWSRLPALVLPLWTAQAQTRQSVYTESLQNGWQDYGWARLDYASTVQAHSGTRSIAVTPAAYAALYLHHDAQPAITYTNLSFWIHGGASGGQLLQVQATVGGAALTAKVLPALAAQWQQVSLPMASLGVTNQPGFDGFWIQDRSGRAQATFYVDDIVLDGTPPSPPSPVALTVNVGIRRHPIAPEVYGVAFAGTAALKTLNVPLNRSGGNTETRYNWQLNAHNHAADFYFESIADSAAAPGAETDLFIRSTLDAGAAPMVTVPMIGWAAKLGPNRGKLASFSIRKYGAQTGNDAAYFADAGNGIKSAGPPVVYVTGNDPNDANVPSDAAFQGAWVDHLMQRWGASVAGGVRHYLLDNEPSLWHATHRDVHPTGARLEEIRDRCLEYAAMVRSKDPGAVIFAPEEWGWSGYLYSGYDQQYGAAHGYSSFPDRAAHGNQDAIPWLLDRWREADAKSGRRSVDVLSVHFYPQGGEFGEDVSLAMQLRRNRSTRALWDPSYVDETWIQSQVRLIPRLKEWVAAHYPGTRIALTEYNWGAEQHVSGALAQADVLGILGREGVDYATRWTCPATNSPVYQAIRLYRNYDGSGAAFGDVSVEAVAPDPDTVAVFAALRTADGAVTALMLNKDPGAAHPVSLTLSGIETEAAAELWRLDSGNRIARLADAGITKAVWSGTLPAQSLTLMVIRPPTVRLKVRAESGTGVGLPLLRVEATGNAGDHLRLDTSQDCSRWTPLRTNVLGADVEELASFPATQTTAFFRATRVP